MDRTRKAKTIRQNALFNWWLRLRGTVSLSTLRRGKTPVMTNSSRRMEKSNTMYAHCRHLRIHRRLIGAIRDILGNRPRVQLLDGLCPLCGLPPVGGKPVEYVLSVHFLDGDHFEYRFRNRRPDACYEVTPSTLKLNLTDTVVHYPLTVIGAIEFGVREIPPDAPEVVAAEHILNVDSASE